MTDFSRIPINLRAQLQKIRRRRLRRQQTIFALLGDGLGNIRAATGKVWVRFQSGMDANGNVTYTPPTIVNAGGNGFFEYQGAGVRVGFDENDQLSITGADAQNAREAGLDTRLLNPGSPFNKWSYIRNIANFKSMAPSGSTLVSVRSLLYDDGYGNLNQFLGTPRLADKIDLASFIPSAGNHRIVVLFLRTTDNTVQTYGSTIQAISSALGLSDYQECYAQRDAESIPIQAWKLENNQSSISMLDAKEDLRNIFNVPQVLGMESPITSNLIIREGQAVNHHGDLFITGSLIVAGDLIVHDGDTRITSEGGSFGDHAAGDYSVFEDDGTLRMEGDAKVWDDLRIPGLSVAKGASAPDLISWLGAGGLMVNGFDGNATSEQVFFTCQLPHSYKQGSDIEPHVHWGPVNANAGNVKWFLEYSWANIDGTFPAITTISIVDAASGTAWDHQVAPFSTITGTGKMISSMLVCRLYRNPGDGDDTYGSDAGFLEFDFHFEKDTIGSRQEFIK